MKLSYDPSHIGSLYAGGLCLFLLVLRWRYDKSCEKLLAEGKRAQATVARTGTSLTYWFTDDQGQRKEQTIPLKYEPDEIRKLREGDTLIIVYQSSKSAKNYPEAALRKGTKLLLYILVFGLLLSILGFLRGY